MRRGKQALPPVACCKLSFAVMLNMHLSDAVRSENRVRVLLQVFFCFTQSVASSRWMLQDEMHISNTECDNCLIGTMIACQYLACLCNIAACIAGVPDLDALADAIDILAQAIWCTYVHHHYSCCGMCQ